MMGSPLILAAVPSLPQLHLLCTGTVLLFWSIALGLFLYGRRYYPRLSALPIPADALRTLPRLSILVPACNEGDTVERAMRSLLEIDYPDLEIIAIDDRSTDETGRILDRMAQRNPLLRVRHVMNLPPGWLGKNHALHVAGEEATGEWLLFTDADVIFAPETLRRAVAYVCSHEVDHLVLSPRCETHGFWERLFVSYFGLMFSFRTQPWKVANPRSNAYAGLGAFNMVRATAYRQFGGHRALPMEVLDDSKLGKVIKRAGFRTELLEGCDLLSVRWVVGLRGVIDGMTKNAFAGFNFDLAYTLASILLLAFTALYPVAALVLPGWPTRLMALTTLAVMTLAAGAMRRITEANAAYGLGYPLASLILIYIILRSTWRTYRQHGIIWRGTLYPLEELRKGVV
jgi:glycosyltransferase involved in cell wall biosynthesis